jgi:hypothetical protein
VKIVVRFIYHAALQVIPKNRVGDKLIAWMAFVVRHGRLPGQRRWLNDVLYELKTTDEILDPLRVFVSDKEFVKLYVRAVVGEKNNVPTIAVLHSPEEVTQFDFPTECCIKPTHASGMTIIRHRGEPVDREQIKSWFRLDYYARTREANYRRLAPKVIVEPLIFDSSNLTDYKLFCVNGAVKTIQVDLDRHTNHTRLLLDGNWNAQPYGLLYPLADHVPKRPTNLGAMIEVAEKLAKPFSFVRVDLYSDGSACFVGEITNCPESAGGRFIPPSAEREASRHLFS